MGYRIVPREIGELPADLDAATRAVVREVQEFTLTTPSRIAVLCETIGYITSNEVPGAIVECGVWRGGSMMAVARTLLNLGIVDRELYLFDTFEGMTAPRGVDRRVGDGAMAEELMSARSPLEADNIWCVASLDEVRANLEGIGYPSHRVHYVRGRVEDTIPGHAPSEIAILRLDTDWYESTRHEMESLYDRISADGVLIVDDYGEWEGARRAVDEYLAGCGFQPLLCRIDQGGRVAVVPRKASSVAKSDANSSDQ